MFYRWNHWCDVKRGSGVLDRGFICLPLVLTKTWRFISEQTQDDCLLPILVA